MKAFLWDWSFYGAMTFVTVAVSLSGQHNKKWSETAKLMAGLIIIFCGPATWLIVATIGAARKSLLGIGTAESRAKDLVATLQAIVTDYEAPNGLTNLTNEHHQMAVNILKTIKQ